MSGEGLTSVRLPQALMTAFLATVQRQRITVHEAVKRALGWLPDLREADLHALPDPPREPVSPRISFYVGLPGLERLDAAVRTSGLSRSRLLRRLLYGLLISRSLQFVQQGGQRRLRIVAVQIHPPIASGTAANSASESQKRPQ